MLSTHSLEARMEKVMNDRRSLNRLYSGGLIAVRRKRRNLMHLGMKSLVLARKLEQYCRRQTTSSPYQSNTATLKVNGNEVERPPSPHQDDHLINMAPVWSMPHKNTSGRLDKHCPKCQTRGISQTQTSCSRYGQSGGSPDDLIFCSESVREPRSPAHALCGSHVGVSSLGNAEMVSLGAKFGRRRSAQYHGCEPHRSGCCVGQPHDVSQSWAPTSGHICCQQDATPKHYEDASNIHFVLLVFVSGDGDDQKENRCDTKIDYSRQCSDRGGTAGCAATDPLQLEYKRPLAAIILINHTTRHQHQTEKEKMILRCNAETFQGSSVCSIDVDRFQDLKLEPTSPDRHMDEGSFDRPASEVFDDSESPDQEDFRNHDAHKYWTWDDKVQNWWHADEETNTKIWAPLEFD